MTGFDLHGCLEAIQSFRLFACPSPCLDVTSIISADSYGVTIGSHGRRSNIGSERWSKTPPSKTWVRHLVTYLGSHSIFGFLILIWK